MSDYDESATAQHAAEDAARAAGGEYRPRYNGWSNRETWNTNLWITNDQGIYEEAREIVRDAMAAVAVYPSSDPDPVRLAEQERRERISHAASALRDWWDDACREQAGALDDDYSGPMSDAWTYALAWVNWDEIAEALAEK